MLKEFQKSGYANLQNGQCTFVGISSFYGIVLIGSIFGSDSISLKGLCFEENNWCGPWIWHNCNWLISNHFLVRSTGHSKEKSPKVGIEPGTFGLDEK